MQYASHATNQDLVSLTRNLCDADSSSYPIAELTLNVNVGYEELVGDILNNDGYWQFDDTNYTDLPRGTGTLVEAQQSYSFASDYLDIEAIEILDTNSRYRRIQPLDHSQLNGQSPDEYFGVDSSGNPTKGFPEFYDKIGDTIFLYPSPTASSVTLASGIQVWFKRSVDLFTTTDTTQQPGLPSPYHYLLAYKAAIPYCIKYHPDRVAAYTKVVDEGSEKLLDHFGRRERDNRKIMTMKKINFI